MRLEQFAAAGKTLDADTVSLDTELARDIQTELSRLGILDPPSDGQFGRISKLAWSTFVACIEPTSGTELTPELGKFLLDSKPDELLPVNPRRDLAGAIWSAMAAKGHWLTRVPGWVNIVYVEGANPDGTENSNLPDQFNDLRTVVTIEEGTPVVLGKWTATTEPGKFYTENPLDPKGAARIALDQFKAWIVGTHGAGIGAHEALVQAGVIRVFRDLNQDYLRNGDAVDAGVAFGVNQHWGYDLQEVGKASAGCLVGQTRNGHRQFMEVVKSDPRYLANKNYRFMTAILTVQDLLPHLDLTIPT